ncbi:hypothetical protein BD413DRAFT_253514 [Trametes elegans]|nr:hypothetical protein BD413DRAFT_253514 [Trametes elegans]
MAVFIWALTPSSLWHVLVDYCTLDIGIPLAYKIPLLVVVMISQYWAFKSPNPPPRQLEYGKSDFLSRVAVLAQIAMLGFSWTLDLCEIIAIIAADTNSDLGNKLLAFLFHDPADVHRLAVTPVFLAGVVLLLIGGGIRKLCYITLGRHFTFELSLLHKHELITTGPYSFVRHPSYTGILPAIAGQLIVEFTPGGWYAESGGLATAGGKAVVVGWTLWWIVLFSGFVRRVPIEDAVLRDEFGGQWHDWARKTPYAIIPFVF